MPVLQRNRKAGETMNIVNYCETCQWYKEVDTGAEWGYCFYLPPVATESEENRPIVLADDKACSKWGGHDE